MIPLGLLISNQKEISVKINDKGLEIEGFYGLNIPYTNITLIDTVSQLPPVRMRTNGYAFGRICIGNFRLMDGRDVKLFIKRGHQPYIFLKTMDNIIIYFNFKDPANTNKTFLQIKEKI